MSDMTPQEQMRMTQERLRKERVLQEQQRQEQLEAEKKTSLGERVAREAAAEAAKDAMGVNGLSAESLVKSAAISKVAGWGIKSDQKKSPLNLLIHPLKHLSGGDEKRLDAKIEDYLNKVKDQGVVLGQAEVAEPVAVAPETPEEPQAAAPEATAVETEPVLTETPEPDEPTVEEPVAQAPELPPTETPEVETPASEQSAAEPAEVQQEEPAPESDIFDEPPAGVRAPAPEEPKPMAPVNATEEEIQVIYGPQATLQKLHTGMDLRADPSAGNVAAQVSKSPEDMTMKKHLEDIHELIQNMESDQEFESKMELKIAQTKIAMTDIERRMKHMINNSIVPIDPNPAKNNGEMLMQIIKMIFGKKIEMSPEQQKVMKNYEDTLSLIGDRIVAEHAGLKEYKKLFEAKRDKGLENDEDGPGGPGKIA